MACVSLNCLKPKETGKVMEISGGCGARKRLYELGLNKGADIKVIKNDFGPIILSLSGNKLALGRGLALNIMISK
jgi:Fe2+ transport system protein FeoA